MKKRTYAHSLCKKTLALFLSLCLLFCLMPSAFSEEAPPDDVRVSQGESDNDPGFTFEIDPNAGSEPDRYAVSNHLNGNYTGTFYLNNTQSYEFLNFVSASSTNITMAKYNVSSSNASNLTWQVYSAGSGYYYLLANGSYTRALVDDNSTAYPWLYNTNTGTITNTDYGKWSIGYYSYYGYSGYYFINKGTGRKLGQAVMTTSTSDPTVLWDLIGVNDYKPRTSLLQTDIVVQNGAISSYIYPSVDGSACYSSNRTFAADPASYLFQILSGSGTLLYDSTYGYRVRADGYETIIVRISCKDTTAKDEFNVFVPAYYIQSSSFLKFVDLHSSANYSTIYCDELCDYATQKWDISPDGSGYYTIKNVNVNKYITLGGEGDFLWMENYNGSDSQKFAITESAYGDTVFVSKYNKDVSVFEIPNSDDLMVNVTNSSPPYPDFTLYRSGSKTKLMGVKINGNSNVLYFNNLMMFLNEIPYNWFDASNRNSYSSTNCIDAIKSSNVFLMMSSGSAGRISLSNNSSGYLAGSDIPSDADFSACKIAIFAGAGTATGSTSDLPSVVVNRGVNVSIGFTNYVTDSEARSWAYSILSEMANGKTVTQAIESTANPYLHDNLSICELCIVYGNSSFAF